MKLEKKIEQFEAYFNPRKNVRCSRFRFFTYSQERGWSIHDYFTELRKLSTDCELEDLQELLLRNKLLIGFNDKNCKKVY